MLSMGENKVSFSPLLHHQALWVENGDRNGSWQSDGVHDAQLILAPENKMKALCLYLAVKKNTLLIETNRAFLSQLTGFETKVLWGKEYIDRGIKYNEATCHIFHDSFFKCKTILWWAMYKGRTFFWLEGQSWDVSQKCISLGYSDIIRDTDFAPSHKKFVFPLLFCPETAHEGRMPSWLRHGCVHQQCRVFSAADLLPKLSCRAVISAFCY